MKQVIFTIVAKNYIGLAQILEKSVRRFHDDIDFYIFVADTFDSKNGALPQNVIIAHDNLKYTEQEWLDMTFKYDLTEFCTSIKPACFQWLFEKDYNHAVYLDPDIYVFAPLSIIFEQLEKYDVALTPQVAGIHVDYQGEHPEWAMNVNGIFNLGFCGMSNSNISKQVLQWWRKRLINECFIDRSVGDFTDQKWMDWMPGFLGNDHLYVFHDLGMNVAPWNYFEREVFDENGTLYVKYRTNDIPQRNDPLLFVHFAGYDYDKLKNGIVSRKRIENLEDYQDILLPSQIYKTALVENREIFDRFIHEPYSYSKYENGKPIASFHRRLYHGFSEEMTVSNPFSVGKDSFYEKLHRKGMIIEERIDNLTQRNMPNMEHKRKQISILFSLLYKIAGYKRYVLFIKSLYNYCRPELHTFLLKKR